MKKILTSIAILAASISTSIAAAPPALEKMQKEMFSHTGRLNGNCSATMIYSDRDKYSGDVLTVFLTAKHCVEDLAERDVFVDLPAYQKNRVVKENRYIAKVRGKWWKGDLALVELKDKQTFFETTAKIAPKNVELYIGEDVWTVGYPYGGVLTVTQGMFGSLETLNFAKPGAEYFRSTPDIAGGNSGGSLYHLGTGGYEIIGVTTARARNDGFIGVYTPIQDIHDYLKYALPGALPDTEEGKTETEKPVKGK